MLPSLLLAAVASAALQQQIVVTAERAEAPVADAACAVAVLDAPLLRATPAVHAADVLAAAPGFAFFSSTLAVRGFYGGGETDAVQLRVDGVPVADVESGVAPWEQFRAAEIERIEVVRGVASPLYGDAALGGVVQLFTRRAEDDAAAVTLTRGSFGTSDVTASIFAGGFSAFGDWQSSDGARPHASSARKGARLQWRGTGAITLWSASADWRAVRRDDPGPLPLHELHSRGADPRFARDGEDTTRTQLALIAQQTRWSASLYASSKANEATRTLLLLPPFADTATRTLDSGEIGASAQLTREQWRAGIDLSAQRFAADWSVARADAGRRSRAAWGTRELRPSERILLTGSLRLDSIDDATAWSPRLGVVAQWRGASLYASAGRGFKAPTLEQLYDVRPLRLFGETFTLANPELEPQRARSIEAGARGARWSADAYLIRVTNEIDFDPRTFRYGNIARSEHRGLEAMWDARPLRVTYAWSRVFSLDDGSRAQLKNITEHSATAMLAGRLPGGVDASALFTWSSGRFYDDAERVRAPGTRALSLRVAKGFGAIALHVDVLNVLDADNAGLGYALTSVSGELVAFAVPEAGRVIRLGVRWRSHRSRTKAAAPPPHS